MTVVGSIDISAALAAAAKRPHAGEAEQKARREALAMMDAETLVAPAYSYRTVPVREVRGEALDLGDFALHAHGLQAISSKLTGVAAIACTLGPALEERVSSLCAARKLSLALALDDLGNTLLLYTYRRVSLLLRAEVRRQGLSAGDSLTPGGRGFALEQQAEVIAMAGGDRIGVTVTERGMLSPVKSRSMVVGIGKGLSAQPLRKRCDICSSRESCRYRAR